MSNETCPAELPNWCAQRHWAIFWILIVCSVAMVTSRVLTIHNQRANTDTPFFSANDRSRWCTIAALESGNTYEIDDTISAAASIRWDSIDKVRHVGRDGAFHYYSSKPPLFPTLVAWKYKALKALTGWDIQTDTQAVVRVLLLLTNVIPWAIFLWFLAKLINSVPVRDWTRYYVLACGGFGTYLATFTNTLNNHLPAAVCVMVTLYLLSEIWRKPAAPWHYFGFAGLLSMFAVANELPALAFFAGAGLICLIRSWQKTMLAFVPMAGLVVAAFFATNYAAHHDWKPAYAHRSDGPVVASVEGDFAEELDAGVLPAALGDDLRDKFQNLSPPLTFKVPNVQQGAWPSTPEKIRRWVVRDQVSTSQIAITSSDSKSFDIHQWQNWYDYPGSYWLSSNDAKKSPIDRGQKSVSLYLFHVLFGHHGIFSLTPMWLFSLAGLIALAGGVRLGGQFSMRWLGWLGLVLSVVVVAFYVSRPEVDRNYGGVSSVLRWLLWLTPIWLVSMLPVVDWLAKSKWGKAICYALLFASVLSALYPANNPWVYPWLYEIWDVTGLPR